MMIVALFSVILAATVAAQTQVLQNPEFSGCVKGSDQGNDSPSWKGGVGSYSFSSYDRVFTNVPSGDDCFFDLFPLSNNVVTQTDIVLDSSLIFDFEMLASCYKNSTRQGSCTFSLTINDIIIPLTNDVLPQANSATLSSISSKSITIPSTPATLKISVFSSFSSPQAFIARATLTGYPDVDSDADSIRNYRDNCVSVHNPDQADYNEDGVGDACECNPDLVAPSIECRSFTRVTLTAPSFSSTLFLTNVVSSVSDNCGPPALSLDKTIFTLRDIVDPVSVKATATDRNSASSSCSTSVVTRMTGSILTNSDSSLLSLRRGIKTTLTWTTKVASFSSSDTVTIKIMSSTGAVLKTIVDRVSFTDGAADVVFSPSLSNTSSFKLHIFLNHIPAGSHLIKFA